MSSNFHKITILNLKADLLEKNPKLASMAAMFESFGGDKSTIENLPKEEVRVINIDKIYGISAIMKTGIEGDDRRCVKIYVSPNDYWVAKLDEHLEKLIDLL